MSYQVTARKWRPQTFAELVGQQHVERTLQNALRQGRIAHAYLFTGTRGVGKTTTARILAKALNCEQGPVPEPCNRCAICLAITQGNAFDVLEIDGASNRGIDEIRDLREKIRYAPARSRYKIYIIDEVHMLTEHAFNALLKTLEEPPPQVVFIFATTEPQKVPVTILSRCQRFDFRQVSNAEITQCLRDIAEQESIKISTMALQRISRRAQGSMRDAQTLFDQVVSYCGFDVSDADVDQLWGVAEEDKLLRLLSAVMARKADEVLELLTLLFQQGHDSREVCRELLGLLRDVLVLKVVPKGHPTLDRSPEEMEGLNKVAAQASRDEVHTLFELLTTTEMRLRESSHPMWMLEMSLIKLTSLPMLEPVATLVTRLESLEQRLAPREAIAGEASAWGIAVQVPPDLPTAAPDRGMIEDPSPSPQLPPLEVDTPSISPTDLVRKIIEGASTRPLGWILEQHCQMQLTESSLEVVFHGNHRMAHELLHEDGTLRTLQQIVHAALGRDLEVRLIDAPLERIAEGRAVASSTPPDENLFSLTRAPVVRETLELFGGRILDVRHRPVEREVKNRSISEDEMVVQEDPDDE